MAQALEAELRTYRERLSSLLPDEGKFVVISGSEVVGVFESYSDALKIGYERFGLTPFLVKKISASEEIAYFTRDLGSCRT